MERDESSPEPVSGLVLIAGSSNTDLVARTARLPRAGETVAGSAFAVHAGGKGANQAVAAARAGAQVVMLAAVGSDQHGADRLEDLRAEGIDVRHVRVIDGEPSGVALIAVADDGENFIVFVPGANDHVQAQQAIDVVRTLRPEVVGLCLEIPTPAVRATLETAKEVDATSVLNVAPWNDTAHDLIPLASIVIANESETAEALNLADFPDDPTDALQRLIALGCTAAVITLGADGATYQDANGNTGHVRPPKVTPVDTTGAGDAFCGTLCAWLAGGAPLAEAVRAGVAAGALATTTHGAQPSFPTRSMIDAARSRMSR